MSAGTISLIVGFIVQCIELLKSLGISDTEIQTLIATKQKELHELASSAREEEIAIIEKGKKAGD